MGFSRRRFVECTCKSVAAMSMASALRRFGMMNAYAQGVSDYKALVCVFMFGGNDGNNTVVPVDSNGGFAAYSNVRPTSGIGLAMPGGGANSLLPITLANQQLTYSSGLFGLHPAMPEIQSLFNSGKLAILANVGALVQPLTRTQYSNAAFAKPSNLFSHSDQQNEWQTSNRVSTGAIGWGGKIADAMQFANAGAQYPMVVSVAGASIYTNGQQTTPVNVLATPGQPQTGLSCSSGSSEANNANCVTRSNGVQSLLTMDSGVKLVQDASATTGNAFTYTNALNNARVGAANILTTFPGNGIGPQLQQVAQIIQVRQALGVKRQIFFVALGGFDTHTNQQTAAGGGAQPSLLQQLSQGLNAFYSALGESAMGTEAGNAQGLQNNVTTFTLSDFSRALQPNTGGGTDHAWGNHQFIMGGAVHGGDMYGQYPALTMNAGVDAGNNGRWIPTTSVDQYGATLAAWFGVDNNTLPAIFPNLSNFASKNLGFV